MTLPNFLIIGAVKAGTTSLWSYLREHPDVYMPPLKAPRFFNSPELRRVTSLAEYEALFDDAGGARAIGEATVGYLQDPAAPGSIKGLIPDAKLIAILRNPADRAYSRFLHSRALGLEPLSDFAEALAAEDARVKEGSSPRYHYRRGGLYHEQIQRYLAQFDISQMRFFLFEEFNSEPLRVLTEIFEFLEVDASFVPDTSLRYGKVSLVPKGRVGELLTRDTALRRAAGKVLPDRAHRRISSAIRTTAGRRPQMDPKVRAWLIDQFRDDVTALEGLLGRSLHWLNLRG